MQATEKLFTSQRFHQITLDDVAHAAGVGKGTIYQHFANKEDLFIQTAAHGFDELCDLLPRGTADDVPFTEQLLGVSQQIATFFAKRRQLFRMMQSEEARMQMCKGQPRQHWAQQRAKLTGAVGQVIAQGVAEGAIRSDIAPEMLASVLLGMLRARAHGACQADAALPLEAIVDLFSNGAQPQPDQADNTK